MENVMTENVSVKPVKVKRKKSLSVISFLISLVCFPASLLPLLFPMAFWFLLSLIIASMTIACIACFKEYSLKGLYLAGLFISAFTGIIGLVSVMLGYLIASGVLFW